MLVIGVPVSLSSEVLTSTPVGVIATLVGSRAPAGSTLGAPLGVALLALLAILLAAQPLLLGLAAIRFGQLDAIGADRAAHEDAVADEPGVFAAHAPEREAARPGEVERLLLLEHVLLQLFPVVVAARQDLLHEGVEVGLGRRRLQGRRRRRGQTAESAEASKEAKAKQGEQGSSQHGDLAMRRTPATEQFVAYCAVVFSGGSRR